MIKTLYHGSDHVVNTPLFGYGKPDNDYGSGFYTTEEKEKANEWAWAWKKDGYGCEPVCNTYEIELDNLEVLDLDLYGTFSWVAEVIANRGLSDRTSGLMGERIVDRYKIDTSRADIIIGYRADDSYMNIIDAFLKNEFSIEEVDRLFRKGNLGRQVFIKSERAFSALKFIKYEIVVPAIGVDYGESERKARREVLNTLQKRENAIQLDGFTPPGILARDAVKNFYQYNSEYCFYMLCDKAEQINDNKERPVKKGKSR